MPYKDLGRVRRTPINRKYLTDVQDIEAIKNSIRNIILTKQGTLPGDPEFGSKLGSVIFEPLDGLTSKLQDSFIRESLIRYEPRVRVVNVDLDEIPEYNRLVIRIEFEYIDVRTGEVIRDNTNIPIDLN